MQIFKIIPTKSQIANQPKMIGLTQDYAVQMCLNPFFLALVLICQTQFKAHIRALIKELNPTGFQDEKIENMPERYWNSFIDSLMIPDIQLVTSCAQGSPAKSEYVLRYTFPILLKTRGIKLNDLNKAIFTDIPKPKYRRMVMLLLKAGFGISEGTISDQELHEAYIVISERLGEIVRETQGSPDYLVGYMEHGGFKLDEAMGVQDFLHEMGQIGRKSGDLRFIKEFFHIQGEKLPPMIAKVIEILYPSQSNE